MFSVSVNTMCINGLFTPATIARMKTMHKAMERLYEAARASGKLVGDTDQANLARLLNVAQQNVNNWEKRGPSKEGLLAAQTALGVNATWVIEGSGPMFMRAPGSQPAYEAHLTKEEVDSLLAEFHAWPFSAPRASYELLSKKDKAALDVTVSRFIAGCLAASPGALPQSPIVEALLSKTGLSESPRLKGTETKK